MPQSPALNRLRAAAGLLPLIESGLRDGKISRDRAGLMAEFCSWAATETIPDSSEASILNLEISQGLNRLRMLIT